ncbi:MAG: RDD family protein [Pseudomonadota bacterium]
MSLPDPDHDPQFYDGVPLRRAVACLIDFVVIAILMIVILLVGTLIGFLTFGLGLVVAIGLFFCAGFLYRFLMLASRSATLGMAATGIVLRDRDGAPVTRATALVHTAGFFITLLFPALMFGGWLLMLGSPHRRLMHDYLPGTTAINRPL